MFYGHMNLPFRHMGAALSCLLPTGWLLNHKNQPASTKHPLGSQEISSERIWSNLSLSIDMAASRHSFSLSIIFCWSQSSFSLRRTYSNATKHMICIKYICCTIKYIITKLFMVGSLKTSTFHANPSPISIVINVSFTFQSYFTFSARTIATLIATGTTTSPTFLNAIAPLCVYVYVKTK